MVYKKEDEKKVNKLMDRILETFKSEDLEILKYACGRLATRLREQDKLKRDIAKAEEELNRKRAKFERDLKSTRQDLRKHGKEE